MHRSTLLAVAALFVIAGAWSCSGDDATTTTSAASTTGSGGMGATNGPSSSSAGGMSASTGSMPSKDAPLILSFTADPPNLPAGGGDATLTWNVEGADSLSIDQGVGAVTGSSTMVHVSATTIYTLTATNVGGSVTSATAVVIGANPARDGDRYVGMVTPVSGESFLGPATLRLIGAAHDPNVFTNDPAPGLGGNASKAQFFIDGSPVLEIDGSNAEYWIFKGSVDGVAKGEHLVWIRGIYVNPAEVLDSAPAIIDVEDPPAYGQTIDLAADLEVGAQDYVVAGTAAKRVRLNGHGHKIVSMNGATGKLTLQFVDVFDLGDAMDTSQSAIDVTTSGDVTIEDSIFDTSDLVDVSLEGGAKASVRRNVFRSNMRIPIGQQPGATVAHFTGSSAAAKVFSGNNVGAGAIAFENTQGWTVGGDTDEDSNVLVGARVGFHLMKSTAMEVRRNYSHHVYYGGWSQGDDFELWGSTGITVEHNVIYGSSWPVRGAGGEFRYNLVLDAGHEWIWPDPDSSIHHNVFVGGDNDVGGVYVLYDPPNVKVFNNTFDGQGNATNAVVIQSGDVTLSSNAFVSWSGAPRVTIQGGTLASDYNLFDTPAADSYSDARMPAHDVSGAGAMLTDPPKPFFDLDERAIWLRTTTTAEVLSIYRGRYTPAAGSPLIDTGDPAGGAGNDIGAVGAGQANTADKFGLP